MKEITSIMLLLLAIYLCCFPRFLYLYQRKLLYFPTPVDPSFQAEEVKPSITRVSACGAGC